MNRMSQPDVCQLITNHAYAVESFSHSEYPVTRTQNSLIFLRSLNGEEDHPEQEVNALGNVSVTIIPPEGDSVSFPYIQSFTPILEGLLRTSPLPDSLTHSPTSHQLFGDHSIRHARISHQSSSSFSLSFPLNDVLPPPPNPLRLPYEVRDDMVMSKRPVHSIAELTNEEMVDMGKMIHRVCERAMKDDGAISYIVLGVFGPNGGQSVDHCHYHVVSWKSTDAKSDPIYKCLDYLEMGVNARKINWGLVRKNRSPQEMATEAAELRCLFE